MQKGMTIDRGLLLDELVKTAKKSYNGDLIILRVGKIWHVAFGVLDEWDVDEMPTGKSFYSAARAAYKDHDRKLEEAIIEQIIKPVLRERGETFDEESERGCIDHLKQFAAKMK
jgi:hypothetical protein